jgi:hypothetical protein
MLSVLLLPALLLHIAHVLPKSPSCNVPPATAAMAADSTHSIHACFQTLTLLQVLHVLGGQGDTDPVHGGSRLLHTDLASELGCHLQSVITVCGDEWSPKPVLLARIGHKQGGCLKYLECRRCVPESAHVQRTSQVTEGARGHSLRGCPGLLPRMNPFPLHVDRFQIDRPEGS